MARQDIVLGANHRVAEYWLRHTDRGREFIDSCDCGRDPRKHVRVNAYSLRGVRDVTVHVVEGRYDSGQLIGHELLRDLEILEKVGNVKVKWNQLP